jgi:hypothetical protein
LYDFLGNLMGCKTLLTLSLKFQIIIAAYRIAGAAAVVME